MTERDSLTDQDILALAKMSEVFWPAADELAKAGGPTLLATFVAGVLVPIMIQDGFTEERAVNFFRQSFRDANTSGAPTLDELRALSVEHAQKALDSRFTS